MPVYFESLSPMTGRYASIWSVHKQDFDSLLVTTSCLLFVFNR